MNANWNMVKCYFLFRDSKQLDCIIEHMLKKTTCSFDNSVLYVIVLFSQNVSYNMPPGIEMILTDKNPAVHRRRGSF